MSVMARGGWIFLFLELRHILGINGKIKHTTVYDCRSTQVRRTTHPLLFPELALNPHPPVQPPIPQMSVQVPRNAMTFTDENKGGRFDRFLLTPMLVKPRTPYFLLQPIKRP